MQGTSAGMLNLNAEVPAARVFRDVGPFRSTDHI